MGAGVGVPSPRTPRRSRYRLVTRSWSIDDCRLGMMAKLGVPLVGVCGSAVRMENGPTRGATACSMSAMLGTRPASGRRRGEGGEGRVRTGGAVADHGVVVERLRLQPAEGDRVRGDLGRVQRGAAAVIGIQSVTHLAVGRVTGGPGDLGRVGARCGGYVGDLHGYADGLVTGQATGAAPGSQRFGREGVGVDDAPGAVDDPRLVGIDGFGEQHRGHRHARVPGLIEEVLGRHDGLPFCRCVAGRFFSWTPLSFFRASAGEKPGIWPAAAAPNSRAWALETGGVYFLPPGTGSAPQQAVHARARDAELLGHGALALATVETSPHLGAELRGRLALRLLVAWLRLGRDRLRVRWHGRRRRWGWSRRVGERGDAGDQPALGLVVLDVVRLARLDAAHAGVVHDAAGLHVLHGRLTRALSRRRRS